jgi:hypothetical protein
VELLLADSRADAGARAIGADADGGFAWSGRRRWCRRRSSAASYRVIDNDRKFRSTDSGSMSSSLSRFSGWRSRSLSLGEGLPDSTGARDGTRADGVLDRGRRRLFFLFSVLPGGAVELPGRSRPAREERIVRTRFGIGISSDHTLEEVGQQFSVTRERIRQIEAKALRKLKHPSRSRVLRSFLDS